MKKILLIGNGPSAKCWEAGEAIDAFEGLVARFNHYQIHGFEKWVGSRTDVWLTTDTFSPQSQDEHQRRIMIHADRTGHADKLAERIGATLMELDIWTACVKKMGCDAPSSGAIATSFFLHEGYEVWLWGFDFLMERRAHHYHNPEKELRGKWHDSVKEWEFFMELLHGDAPVHYLGWDPATQSCPLVRQPLPCGSNDNLSSYRDPAHQPWYQWFCSLMEPASSVLDIGAGMGDGMRLMRKEGMGDVWGFDVDSRLSHLDAQLVIGSNASSLRRFRDNSFDYLTCVDVIEHVVEDMILMREMRRIARKGVFVTTPNGVRSKAGNPAHCREYSIAQFANVFRPSQVYSASPDGAVHRTKLLERTADGWLNFSPQGPMNRGDEDPLEHRGIVPWNTRFNTTVDGQEWAHICGLFF